MGGARWARIMLYPNSNQSVPERAHSTYEQPQKPHTLDVSRTKTHSTHTLDKPPGCTVTSSVDAYPCTLRCLVQAGLLVDVVALGEKYLVMQDRLEGCQTRPRTVGGSIAPASRTAAISSSTVLGLAQSCRGWTELKNLKLRMLMASGSPPRIVAPAL